MQKKSTAFYAEAIILLLMFVVVLTILASVFAETQRKSANARELTVAVALAKNSAEAVSAVKSQDELAELLNEKGNVTYTDSGICVRYDEEMKPDPMGEYSVYIAYEPAQVNTGIIVNGDISVKHGGDNDVCYSMPVAVYFREEALE